MKSKLFRVPHPRIFAQMSCGSWRQSGRRSQVERLPETKRGKETSVHDAVAGVTVASSHPCTFGSPNTAEYPSSWDEHPVWEKRSVIWDKRSVIWDTRLNQVGDDSIRLECATISVVCVLGRCCTSAPNLYPGEIPGRSRATFRTFSIPTTRILAAARPPLLTSHPREHPGQIFSTQYGLSRLYILQDTQTHPDPSLLTRSWTACISRGTAADFLTRAYK